MPMSPSDAAVLLGLPIGADPERRYTAYMAERKRFEDKIAAAKGLANQQDRYRQHIAKLDEAYQVMETAFPGPPVSTTRFDKKKTGGNLSPAARAGSSAAIPAKERGATSTNLGTNRITRPTQPPVPGEKPPTTAMSAEKSAEKSAGADKAAPGVLEKLAEKPAEKPLPLALEAAPLAPMTPAPTSAPPVPANPLNLPPLPTGGVPDGLPDLPPPPPPLAITTGRIANPQAGTVVPEGMVMVPASLFQSPPTTNTIRRPSTSVFVRSDGSAQSLPAEPPAPVAPGPSALVRNAPAPLPLETEFDRPTRITFQRAAPGAPLPSLSQPTPTTSAFSRVDAESPSMPAHMHVPSPSTMELERARAAWQRGERMALPNLAETGAAAALADDSPPQALPSLAGLGTAAADPAPSVTVETSGSVATAGARPVASIAAASRFVATSTAIESDHHQVRGFAGFFTKEGTPNCMVWCGIDMLVVEVPSVLKTMTVGIGLDSIYLVIAAFLSLPFAVALLFQAEWAAWPARILISLQIYRNLRWFLFLIGAGFGALAATHLCASAVLILALVMLHSGTSQVSTSIWIHGQLLGAVCYLISMLGALGMVANSRDTGTLPPDVKIEHGHLIDSTNCFSFVPPPGWILSRNPHGIECVPKSGEPGTVLDVDLIWSGAGSPTSVIDAWGVDHFFHIGSQEAMITASGMMVSTIEVENENRHYLLYAASGAESGAFYLVVGSYAPNAKGDYSSKFRAAATSLNLTPGIPPHFDSGTN